jgi:acyl carrier protein
MDALTTLKLEIKRLIVEALDLEDVAAEDIGDDIQLFGDEGLGLDSIDALELGVALRKKYQVQLEAGDAGNREHFRSVNSLARLVQGRNAPAGA